MQTIPVNAYISAEDALKKRSVQFNEDLRYDPLKAYPFHYSLMTQAIIDANNGVEPFGWLVPAKSYTDIPIVLDRDMAWHMLNLKYSVYERYGFLENFGLEPYPPLRYRYWDQYLIKQELLPPNTAEYLQAGTIDVAAPVSNISAVVGTGTTFTDFERGDLIYVNATGEFGFVASVTDDLNMTLFGSLSVASGSTYYQAGDNLQSNAPGYLPKSYITSSSGYNAILTPVFPGFYFNPLTTPGDILHYAYESDAASGTLTVTDVANRSNIIVDETVRPSFANLFLAKRYTTVPMQQPLIPGVQTLKGGTPRYPYLTRYIKASVLFPSLDNQYMYGISQKLLGDIPNQGLIERRVSVDSLQGANSGLGMVRTQRQLPFDGQIVVRLQNIHPLMPLYVNGALFGYKIRGN